MKIGIDIVAIKRISKLYEKFGINFLKRIFTEKEIEEIMLISNSQRKIEKISGKFAAKEAVFKLNLSYKSFKEIEILTDENGAPFLTDNKATLSISHEKEYAVAVALVDNRR